MRKLFQKISAFFLEGGLKETVLRFPLPSLFSLLIFFYVIGLNHDYFSMQNKDEARLIAIFSVGFFWFGGVRLMAESQMWSRAKEYAAAAIGFVPFVLLMIFAEQFGEYLIFIVPSLLLFLMVSPFLKTLRDNQNDYSFWKFNQVLWTGVLVSFLAIGIMMGGLHAAVASIEALFGVDFGYNFMGDIWAFSALLVGPIYALSWVPKTFQFNEGEEKAPTGLPFMLNWILAPLILIYFLILYAYLVKIIVTQSMPVGTLAYMVTGFAGAGVVTYLAGWPLQEKCGALLQKIYKYLFPALAIPVVLQFIAIGGRIHEFGVTEQRYMIVLCGIWLAIIIAAFVFKKVSSIKIIPAVLAGLFIVAAFGPWGAVGLSGYSQMNRLESLLIQYEILQDGQIVRTSQEIPFKDRKNISSKLEYLSSTNRFEEVLSWIPEDKRYREPSELHEEKEKKSISYYDLTKLMGFEYVNQYQRGPSDDRFHLYGENNYRGLIRVAGYDYSSINLYAYARDPQKDPRNQDKIKANSEKGTPEVRWALDKENNLTVSVEGRGDVRFNLTGLIEKRRQSLDEQNRTTMVQEAFGQGMKIRLIFTSISGKVEDGKAQAENVSFTMLLDL